MSPLQPFRKTSEINAVLKKGSNETSPSDGDTSVATYIDKANKGEAWAQNNLGVCYYTGNGVKQDFNEAAKWYRKSAEQGHVHAQYNLGLCYEFGLGVYEDLKEAKKWYKKAADNGHEKARERLLNL